MDHRPYKLRTHHVVSMHPLIATRYDAGGGQVTTSVTTMVSPPSLLGNGPRRMAFILHDHRHLPTGKLIATHVEAVISHSGTIWRSTGPGEAIEYGWAHESVTQYLPQLAVWDTWKRITWAVFMGPACSRDGTESVTMSQEHGIICLLRSETRSKPA